MTVVVPQSGVMNLVPPSTSVGSYRRAAMGAAGPPPRPSTPVYNAEGTDPHRDARRVAVLALYHLYTVRSCLLAVALLLEVRRSTRASTRCEPILRARAGEGRRQLSEESREPRKRVHAWNKDETGWKKWTRNWRSSPWWELLNSRPDEILKRATFERRVRLSWSMFHELLEGIKQWDTTDTSRVWSVPIELKLAAALRHLATGAHWDALGDSFKVSEKVLREWFWDKFAPWFMECRYSKHVRMPRSQKEIESVEKLYSERGFPGCVGCVDGFHIPFGGFRTGNRPLYVGKEKYPSVVLQCSCDILYRVLYVSPVHPGATNDKSVIIEDEYSCAIEEEPAFTEYPFTLLSNREPDSAGDPREEVVRTDRTGAYLLCDGGYPPWRHLVCPPRYCLPGSPSAYLRGQIEQVRKVIECVYGHMTKRFIVLDNVVKRQSMQDVRTLFCICAALHNWLLEEKGYEWCVSEVRDLRDADNAERADVTRLDDDMMRNERNNETRRSLAPIDGMHMFETSHTHDTELGTREDLQAALAIHVALYHAHVGRESTVGIRSRAMTVNNSSARVLYNPLIGASVRARR